MKPEAISMKDKVCVVTGATAGIGEVTARALASMGARVVLVGRSREKAEASAARIKAATKNEAVEIALADLAVQDEVRALGADLTQRFPRIDVLVNNAGAYFATREETQDGIEMTFALNHLSYFLLTHLLLDSLKAAGDARVVNVSSAAHKGAKLDFDDLQSKKAYHGFSVYGRTKLANILFTAELARRLEGTGVSTTCLHPGFVASSFGHNNHGIVRFAVRLLQGLFAMNTDEGAATSIYLASSPDVASQSGKYFVKRKAATPSRAARDTEAAKRLWQQSEALLGL